MPLDLKDFEKHSVAKTSMKLGSNQLTIAQFLLENGKQAFTQKEIKFRTGIKFDAAVNTALHSLKIKGLVENKTIGGTLYWRGTHGLHSIDTEDKGADEQETPDEQD